MRACLVAQLCSTLCDRLGCSRRFLRQEYWSRLLFFLWAIPLRGLEGVPGLPGAPQDEAGLTRKFETSHVGGTGLWLTGDILCPQSNRQTLGQRCICRDGPWFLLRESFQPDKVCAKELVGNWASLVAHTVKNPLALRETWIRSLG